MFWCPDPSPGISRLHGYPSDRSLPQRPRPVHRGTVQACPQLDSVAFLFRIRRDLRNVGAFLSQVVNRLKSWFSQLHLMEFIAGVFAMVFFSGPISAADISDITFRSGSQLKERFSELYRNNQDFATAVSYFKRPADIGGLVEISFRVDKAPDLSNLFLVPFIDESRGEPKPLGDLKRLVILAQTPKSARVLLGTISTEGTTPEVKEEKVAVEGKIEPGKGQLKAWFKCTAVGCVPAGFGCLYGGPAWVPCFFLWCGGALVTCGLTELLFP